MICKEVFKGKFVTVRSAEVDDSEITLRMRMNPERTKYLHAVEGTVEGQRAWLAKQRECEGDYLFVCENRQGDVIGMVGLYEIENGKGHLGRLLMYGSAVESFESTILVMEYGFYKLGLREMIGDVDERNTASLRFSESLGVKFNEPIYDAGLDRNVLMGVVTRDSFQESIRPIKRWIYPEIYRRK